MQFMVKAQENEADISKCTVREKHFPMKGIRLPLDPTGKRRGGEMHVEAFEELEVKSNPGYMEPESPLSSWRSGVLTGINI